jgi:hypothetical protein
MKISSIYIIVLVVFSLNSFSQSKNEINITYIPTGLTQGAVGGVYVREIVKNVGIGLSVRHGGTVYEDDVLSQKEIKWFWNGKVGLFTPEYDEFKAFPDMKIDPYYRNSKNVSALFSQTLFSFGLYYHLHNIKDSKFNVRLNSNLSVLWVNSIHTTTKVNGKFEFESEPDKEFSYYVYRYERGISATTIDFSVLNSYSLNGKTSIGINLYILGIFDFRDGFFSDWGLGPELVLSTRF